VKRSASAAKSPVLGCLLGLALAGGCASSPAAGSAEDAGEPPAPADAAAKPTPPRADAAPSPGDVAAAPPGPGVDAARAEPDAPGGPPPPTPSGWWDARWRKRARITVSDPALKEELSDFQVLVKLEPGGLDYAAARGDGADLRFIAADGTRLDHEIDGWSPGGTSWLWLRLPKLGPAPVTIWLYYGNEAAPAPADAEVHGTWPAPYTGVWHLSGNGKDSTANGFDGAQMVGGAFAEGRIAKGLLLDGSKRDHITLKADIKLVAGAPGCTFSAWINPTRVEDSVNGMIIMTVGKWFNNNHNSYTDFNINASGQLISHVDPGTNTAASGYARILSDPGFVKTNEWAWVTYVIDLPGKEERFFKNGQLVSTKPPPAGKAWAAAFIDMVSSRVVIGAEEDVVSHFYTGSMDELRIEKGMRTPAWIAAQFRSMTTPGYVKVEAE
jgi:biopolymer transport protein ExbB